MKAFFALFVDQHVMGWRFVKVFFACLLIFFLRNIPVRGQVTLKGASDIHGLKFWLGLKAGVTFSKAQPIERYSAIGAPSGQKQVDEEKKYGKVLKNRGQTIGVIFGYAATQHVLFTFQPAYSYYKYAYTTSYKWQNSTGDAYQISTEQNNRLGYIELPLSLLLRKQWGHVEPYVHVGWYYGFFVGGKKKVKYTESLVEGGSESNLPSQTEVYGVGNQLMKWQMGALAGVGIAYTIQYFRIGLELAYKQGFYNLTDVKTRYKDKHMISKFFEVPDDFRLNQMELTLNFFMPIDNLIHLHASQKSRAGRK